MSLSASTTQALPDERPPTQAIQVPTKKIAAPQSSWARFLRKHQRSLIRLASHFGLYKSMLGPTVAAVYFGEDELALVYPLASGIDPKGLGLTATEGHLWFGDDCIVATTAPVTQAEVHAIYRAARMDVEFDAVTGRIGVAPPHSSVLETDRFESFWQSLEERFGVTPDEAEEIPWVPRFKNRSERVEHAWTAFDWVDFYLRPEEESERWDFVAALHEPIPELSTTVLRPKESRLERTGRALYVRMSASPRLARRLARALATDGAPLPWTEAERSALDEYTVALYRYATGHVEYGVVRNGRGGQRSELLVDSLDTERWLAAAWKQQRLRLSRAVLVDTPDGARPRPDLAGLDPANLPPLLDRLYDTPQGSFVEQILATASGTVRGWSGSLESSELFEPTAGWEEHERRWEVAFATGGPSVLFSYGDGSYAVASAWALSAQAPEREFPERELVPPQLDVVVDLAEWYGDYEHPTLRLGESRFGFPDAMGGGRLVSVVRRGWFCEIADFFFDADCDTGKLRIRAWSIDGGIAGRIKLD